MKPFKGEIIKWYKHYFDKEAAKEYYGEDVGLGYIICGTCVNHPQFGTDWNFHTSWVIFQDTDGNVETRNSRYKLIGPENASSVS